MQISVSKATNLQLDWMVAKCLGITPVIKLHKWDKGASLYPYCGATIPLEYSTRWSQGGPIIDTISDLMTKAWPESKPDSKYEVHVHNYDGNLIQFGPTLLIAAMRCYVVSKLGEIVEVPDKLQ